VSVSRHTGYNLIGSVIPIVLSLVTVPIYLKLVGPDRYGVLSIAWLLLGYFGLFDLGLGRATSFRIASLRDASPQARADTFWSALAVNIGMGFVGGLVLWVAAGYFFGHAFKVSAQLRPEMLGAVPLLAAAVPVATMMGVLTGAVQGRERFLEINMNSVMSTALFQLLPLAVAWKYGPNLVWLLAAALSARVVGALGLAYRCWQELVRGQRITPHRSEIVTLLKYGGWVNLTSIFGPVLVMIDRFAIGALIGASAVTSYTVPVQLGQRLTILPAALTTALFPRLSAAKPEERSALAERALLSLAGLTAAAFVAAVFVIGPFLQLWVGKRLGPEAGMIGRCFVAATFANSLSLISFTRLQASGRPDLVTKILLAEIPPYLAVLYVGMHYFGLRGAAVATSMRLVVDFLLLTSFAGPPKKGRGLLAGIFGLLAAAVWLAGRYSFTQWEWWASAAALSSAGLLLGFLIVPNDVKQLLLGRVRGWLRLSGFAALASERER
jgi:O-antigen/teichoic acid export membrane protein